MRIGLAGGGSDTADHEAAGGGAVVSAAIDLSCRATLRFQLGTDRLAIDDRRMSLTASAAELRRAAHAHMVDTYGLPSGDYRLETASDMPSGCGLGSSSSLVVAIVSAYARAFDLPLGRHETADAAWRIERQRLGWPGGLQDQLAAAFGGLHLFRFGPGTRIDVDRCDDLRLIARLQASLCLFTPGIYKSVPPTPPTMCRATTTTLRDDALRLWSDLSCSAFDALPAILTRSHRIKAAQVPPETASILGAVAAIETVKAIKLCGAGPAGVFLVHHDGGFDELMMTARSRRIAGRFVPFVIAPATPVASTGSD